MRVFFVNERAFPSAEGRLAYSPHVFQALSVIARSPGMRASDLTLWLGLVPTTTSSLIARMVTKGLIEKRTHPDDGRAIALYLTEEGTSMQDAIHRQDMRNMDALLAGLNGDERDTLLYLMGKIVDSVEEEERLAEARQAS